MCNKEIRLCWWRYRNIGDELSAYLVRRIMRQQTNKHVSIKWVSEDTPHKLIAVGSMINRVTLKYPSIFWGTGILEANNTSFKTSPSLLRLIKSLRFIKKIRRISPPTFCAVRGPLTRSSF